MRNRSLILTGCRIPVDFAEKQLLELGKNVFKARRNMARLIGDADGLVDVHADTPQLVKYGRLEALALFDNDPAFERKRPGIIGSARHTGGKGFLLEHK